ncbi:MAG: amidase [Actinomadura sp.]
MKDAIDIKGVPTTAGCRAVADRAEPAAGDAPVVATARAAGARVVGKANLTELCLGTDGVNPWSGTPVNPLDPERVPGGSSSGSAVAVATGEADVALGTDTGGSVRIPAACCGIAGLKTTHGRVPLDGVYPLAPSLDTVGPLGQDVAAVALGMNLIEPGFTPEPYDPAMTVGRLRVPGVDPAIDAAVDAALRLAFEVIDERSGHWADALIAAGVIVTVESHRHNHALLDGTGQVTERVGQIVRSGANVTAEQLTWTHSVKTALRAELDALLDRHGVLALPVLTTLPPMLGSGTDDLLSGTLPLTFPVNLSGLPAFALPVPLPGSPLPTAVQLIGTRHSEERLCGVAATLEAALS